MIRQRLRVDENECDEIRRPLATTDQALGSNAARSSSNECLSGSERERQSYLTVTTMHAGLASAARRCVVDRASAPAAATQGAVATSAPASIVHDAPTT